MSLAEQSQKKEESTSASLRTSPNTSTSVQETNSGFECDTCGEALQKRTNRFRDRYNLAPTNCIKCGKLIPEGEGIPIESESEPKHSRKPPLHPHIGELQKRKRRIGALSKGKESKEETGVVIRLRVPKVLETEIHSIAKFSNATWPELVREWIRHEVLRYKADWRYRDFAKREQAEVA